jgi:hypothetical protein
MPEHLSEMVQGYWLLRALELYLTAQSTQVIGQSFLAMEHFLLGTDLARHVLHGSALCVTDRLITHRL